MTGALPRPAVAARLAVFCLALAGAPLAAQDQGTVAPQPRPADAAEASGAVLRALDKVSGSTTDLTVRRNETRNFGKLGIQVSDCRFPADDPTSNAWAHLTITDTVAGQVVFDGWMVASSPALSALDHPRYDVWVLSCTTS